ncbi:hypothetical protein AAC387_Pa05g1763 [Persea americana]
MQIASKTQAVILTVSDQEGTLVFVLQQRMSRMSSLKGWPKKIQSSLDVWSPTPANGAHFGVRNMKLAFRLLRSNGLISCFSLRVLYTLHAPSETPTRRRELWLSVLASSIRSCCSK